METQDQILDYNINEKSTAGGIEQIMSVNKFILLSVITLGIYPIWWAYKAWRFFKEQEKSDIVPGARALFGIIFLYSLMYKILEDARRKSYPGSYSPGWLFSGFIVGGLLGRASSPFWIISLLNIACLIPPFKALNYIKQNSPGIIAVEQAEWSGRQLGLLIAGLIFWVLVIYGLSL